MGASQQFGYSNQDCNEHRFKQIIGSSPGLELQAQLNAERCRIPTIFITAHGDARMRMQALRAGASEFLSKPFDDEALLQIVQAALES